MSVTKKRINFFDSEEGIEIERLLQLMVEDDAYNTDPSYTANATLYPDNLMPFINKHMNFLSSHPNTDPWHYISNLRLMTRISSYSAR